MVAQLIERSPRLRSVVSSNPTQGSSSYFLWKERAVLGVVDLFALPCLSTSLPSCWDLPHWLLHISAIHQILELDLSTVVPSLSGPKRPHDRVSVSDMKTDFSQCLQNKVSSSSYSSWHPLSLFFLFPCPSLFLLLSPSISLPPFSFCTWDPPSLSLSLFLSIYPPSLSLSLFLSIYPPPLSLPLFLSIFVSVVRFCPLSLPPHLSHFLTLYNTE